MRWRISSSWGWAVASSTAWWVPGAAPNQARASNSARRDLPLFWPPRISSLRTGSKDLAASTILAAPIHHDAVQLRHPIGQRRRAGLQDVSGLDLKQLAVPHRVHVLPARP